MTLSFLPGDTRKAYVRVQSRTFCMVELNFRGGLRASIVPLSSAQNPSTFSLPYSTAEVIQRINGAVGREMAKIFEEQGQFIGQVQWIGSGSFRLPRDNFVAEEDTSNDIRQLKVEKSCYSLLFIVTGAVE